jgi:hypothetical protein
MRFARWIFAIATIWGVVVIAPLYFAERLIAENDPPAINHPEYFYGFVGVTLAWQFVYGLIATDPVRYRPVMLIGAAGKLSFVIACALLFAGGRLSAPAFYPSLIDLLLVLLFLFAWLGTAGREADRAE